MEMEFDHEFSLAYVEIISNACLVWFGVAVITS